MNTTAFETEDYYFTVTQHVEDTHDFEVIFKTGDCAGYTIRYLDWAQLTIRSDGSARYRWKTELIDVVHAYGLYVNNNPNFQRHMIATQAAMWAVLRGPNDTREEEVRCLLRNCKMMCIALVSMLWEKHS